MSFKNAIKDQEFLQDVFPKNFIWGMGTASYQCEGGWNADGKGLSIWDTFVHTSPEKIADRSNGDVALDSYHHYKQDVQMLKLIGANVYRFSLSWARILPTGRIDQINQAGIDHYNRVIDELLSNGIEPMITLYHWDLPQGLQDNGGWLNEEIVQTFGDYAKLCFEKFGDRVKKWTTVNEPWISSMMGYYHAFFAPCIKEPLEAPYTYVHNQLKAHANAYRIYESNFKSMQKGIVGINLDTSYYIPYDENSPDDIAATNQAFKFRMGWILNPLFHGEYPKVMRELIDARSKQEGRSKSRLPEFDEAWAKKIKGAVDFVGINFYNAELCKARKESEEQPKWEAFYNPFFSPNIPGWNEDCQVYRCHDPNWERCGAEWQDFTPQGIRGCIKWVADNYGNPIMMVTETGCSAKEEGLDDKQREKYFKLSINSVLKSIKKDGCNVVGYVGWSLLDVFEWMSGHTIGFGIIHVDKKSPNMTRTPKNSAKFIAQIFKNNGFPPEA